jgi:molybdenum cofactor cytidylyltransferase
MRALTVEIREAAGRVLCSTIFRPGGKKLLAKGHIIRDEDVRLLESEGMESVWVTELEDGEMGEDEAVLVVGREVACGAVELRPAAGGRLNLLASEPSCVLVDEELLRQINCTASMAIATVRNFSFAAPGQRIATVKSAPFAVPRDQVDAIAAILRERGAILNARAIRKPTIGVVYCDPLLPERGRQLFETVVRQKLERFGVQPGPSVTCLEEEAAVAQALQQLLRSRVQAILIASTTSPAGPEDAVGRAIARAGCHLERFLAPVEPGALLLLGYQGEIPMVSAPGCFRSARENIVDLILPPMLAKYRVSGWEISCLGHGGLLT